MNGLRSQWIHKIYYLHRVEIWPCDIDDSAKRVVCIRGDCLNMKTGVGQLAGKVLETFKRILVSREIKIYRLSRITMYGQGCGTNHHTPHIRFSENCRDLSGYFKGSCYAVVAHLLPSDFL